MTRRELNRRIRILSTFLQLHLVKLNLTKATMDLLTYSYGARLGRKEVYTALGEASGRVVNNGFVAECDAVLEALGGRKGNSSGYRSWRHLAWRSQG